MTGDPKDSPSVSTYWLGFEFQAHYGYLWGHTLFRAHQGTQMANTKAQNQDLS